MRQLKIANPYVHLKDAPHAPFPEIPPELFAAIRAGDEAAMDACLTLHSPGLASMAANFTFQTGYYFEPVVAAGQEALKKIIQYEAGQEGTQARSGLARSGYWNTQQAMYIHYNQQIKRINDFVAQPVPGDEGPQLLEMVRYMKDRLAKVMRLESAVAARDMERRIIEAMGQIK